MGKLPRKQRGVALIVVLLIVALVAVIATNINSRNHLSMRRTLNLAQYDQAYWYALSAEELTKKVLKQDLEDAEGRVHRQQYWAQADVVFPAEHGEIGGKISDMRACFNLNSLSIDTKGQLDGNGQPKLPLAAIQYQGLLMALGMDEFSAERLTHTLKDYLDEDTTASPFGAEDAEYESRNVPYRAANTLMSHRSELRAVMGYSQDIYLKLLPYICVIPGNTQQLLNVNTIEVEQAALLAGMFDDKMSVSEAESIINQRPGDGFEKIEDFKENSSVAGLLAADAALSSSFVVDSKYFRLEAGAKVDTATFRLESIIKTDGSSFEILTRQFGGQK
ncbi:MULTISPECIES: type II secretion system minor pseudopilin GspK [Shewanella]|uniref:Type II secretion system protein K n=1 Tax=Shewanella nanhaiensis TaxID=2864872 RepID=A0ABS7E6X9_9GAMM|nr:MULTISPECIES: type II secretion system minor pseudopilin GspK [Shewanella]MBW8185113.1 type II secretion system minor pseudopilin GspK [Shewanella nanhaiensis]